MSLKYDFTGFFHRGKTKLRKKTRENEIKINAFPLALYKLYSLRRDYFERERISREVTK